MKRISDIPEKDRPREKLQSKGSEALSDLELLAVLLGSGTKGHDVMSVAGRILKALDDAKNEVSVEQLEGIEGVGPAKATLIAAALEFARRRIRPGRPENLLSRRCAPAHHELCRPKAGALPLRLHQRRQRGYCYPRRFSRPRQQVAGPPARGLRRRHYRPRQSAIIIAHNHPSGPLTPSKEDIEVTKRLKVRRRTPRHQTSRPYDLQHEGVLQPLRDRRAIRNGRL